MQQRVVFRIPATQLGHRALPGYGSLVQGRIVLEMLARQLREEKIVSLESKPSAASRSNCRRRQLRPAHLIS